jgi:hypothetical protein
MIHVTCSEGKADHEIAALHHNFMGTHADE